MMRGHPSLRFLATYWKPLLVVLTPLVFLPLPVVSPVASSWCAYVILVMGVYWVFEVLPLAVTSLIPIAVFPMLGVLSSDDTSMCYLKGGCVLFLGGSILATAVEQSQLHRRIALNAMLLMGTSPRFIMLGFMLPAAFLSMWISNTAATALMMPMHEAIVNELCAGDEEEALEEGVRDKKTDRKKESHLRAMLAMTICYSANIGGTATTIGTPPNVFLIGLLNDEYGDAHPLNFSTWIAFGLPQAILCLLAIWIWLQIYYIGFPKLNSKKKNKQKDDHSGSGGVRALMLRKRDELGPWSFAEVSVLTIFCTLILVWFFRSPGFMTGWGDLLSDNYDGQISINDGSVAILFALLLFSFPSKPAFFKQLFSPSTWFKKDTKWETSPALVQWSFFESKMSWGILLLMGSGYALAEASDRSGLSQWMGEQLEVLSSLDPWQLSLVVSIIAAVLTQICSNVATSAMLLPVLNALSLSPSMCMNPLYVMLPPTLACSYAFMLPASNGSNAIAFGSASMTTMDMMKLGFVLMLLCVGIDALVTNTYGVPMFDLNNMPEWTNVTCDETFRSK